jgi:YbgC/YbaW family acyl-CoA thioester hydrolase
MQDDTPVRFESSHHPTFDDLDPFGHLGSLRYLSLFLEHRWTALRAIGLDLATVAKLPIAFVTKDIALSFKRPVRGDQELRIASSVVSWGEKDCVVHCEMHAADRVAATCEITLVCVGKEDQRPMPWPSDFKARFFESR